jgi:hypothetical protein
MRLILAFALAAAGLTLAPAEPRAQGARAPARTVLQVRLDESTVLRLGQAAQTLVIGNPAVADAVVHDGSTIIVTGKSFGTTNLIALSRSGEILAERQIHVGQPESSILTVQRGGDLETYACAPQCRRAPVIGDAQARFGEAIAQAQARNGLAAPGASR